MDIWITNVKNNGIANWMITIYEWKRAYPTTVKSSRYKCISRVSLICKDGSNFSPLPPALAHKLIQSRDQLPRHAAKWDAIVFFFLFYFIVFPLQLHAADRFRVSNDKGTRARIRTIDVCTLRDGDICGFPLKLDRDRNIQIFSPFGRTLSDNFAWNKKRIIPYWMIKEIGVSIFRSRSFSSRIIFDSLSLDCDW